jgi:hypothetical protein
MMAHTCQPSYAGSVNKRISVHVYPGINLRLYSKNKGQGSGSLAQVVEHLLNKH